MPQPKAFGSREPQNFLDLELSDQMQITAIGFPDSLLNARITGNPDRIHSSICPISATLS